MIINYMFMGPRYDIRIKDIQTISSFSKRKKINYLKYIRPLVKNNTVNTIFKWKYNALTVKLSGNWDLWGKKISLRKSVDEFSIILPLKPGFFRYKFSIEYENFFPNDGYNNSGSDKILPPYSFTYCRKIKILDKEVISSDSLLDNEIKIFSSSQKFSKIEKNESNKLLQHIPLHLLNAVFFKGISIKELFSLPRFSFCTETPRNVLCNHLLISRNLNKKMSQLGEIFSIKIKFKEKTCILLHFNLKNFILRQKFHPIKNFFNGFHFRKNY